MLRDDHLDGIGLDGEPTRRPVANTDLQKIVELNPLQTRGRCRRSTPFLGCRGVREGGSRKQRYGGLEGSLWAVSVPVLIGHASRARWRRHR
jgi:hypothetical protein